MTDTMGEAAWTARDLLPPDFLTDQDPGDEHEEDETC
jgi:hypothetical protein